MNIDTVETSGVDASSPDFAEAVDKWETYGQKTFSAAFADNSGYVLSRKSATITNPATLGYYEDVTVLPSSGVTSEEFYLTKRVRYNGDPNHGDGTFKEYSVKATIPVGTKVSDLLDANGKYKLTGSIYSRVNGGVWWANTRPDYGGWWGTGLINPDEYAADNIHASFHLVQGGTLNNGFGFMINESESTYSPIGNNGQSIGEQARALSGYFISYSSHNCDGQNRRTLWRMDNRRLDNSFSAPGSINNSNIMWCYPVSDAWKVPGTTITSGLGEKITCLATWTNDSTDLDYDITCKDGNIVVKETEDGNTRTVANVNDSTYTKGTYGFWGNNCEQADESMVTNFNVEITKTKSFGDIVYEPEWADGALGLTSGLAEDAAEILERDYDIDAGEVLSMNIDTVETSGVDASSPDFAKVVKEWDTYGQYTYSAAFADDEGYMLSKRDPAVESPTTLGYYIDVTELVAGGVTPEEYYLTKRVRYKNDPEHGEGMFKEYSVKTSIPAGTKVSDLLDPAGEYRLTGSVYSRVNGGVWYANERPDYGGWWGTALINPNEKAADNIHASFRLVQGGTLNNGFMFMVNESESTYSPVGHNGVSIGEEARSLSGYFITYSSHVNNYRTLWRFDNWKLDNSFSAPNSLSNLAIWCNSNRAHKEVWYDVGSTFTSPLGETVTNLATWENNAKDVDYDITCKEGQIIVQETQNGATRTVADVKDSTYTKGTYGFWGNNCEQADESIVTNLNVEITKTKSFGDIVYEPEWADGALHMLINMDTKADSTMLGSDGGRRIAHQRRPSPAAPPGPPRGWRRTRRRSWRGTTT